MLYSVCTSTAAVVFVFRVDRGCPQKRATTSRVQCSIVVRTCPNTYNVFREVTSHVYRAFVQAKFSDLNDLGFFYNYFR